MNEHLYAVIMAGGGGTRLWPLSRPSRPKQSLRLFGNRTLFQVSVDRLRPLLPQERIFVVTGASHVDALAEQVPDLPRENFIIEPQGRGTAPCIGLAALHMHHLDPQAVMAVLTADHFIKREAEFRATLQAAQEIAEQGYLVTLGIEPTSPATGYGYIQRGARLGQINGREYYRVEQFTEKPNPETALRFLQAGVYSWNSGMFIWQIARIRAEFARQMPELHATLTELGAVWGTPDYETLLANRWPSVPKQTIDYGIMEKARQVAVMPVDLGWSDVGTWDAVMALHAGDESGNVLRGDVVAVDTSETLVLAQGKRTVATIGVRDLIVVDTPDAVLITHRNHTQQVRDVVARLKAQRHRAVE